MKAESHTRSIVKAVSWRMLGTASTGLMVFWATREWKTAFMVGGAEFFFKTALFYAHERVWNLSFLRPSRVAN